MSTLKRNLYPILLMLSALEGAAAVVTLLAQRSGERTAMLLGYSTSRLGIVMLTTGFTAALAFTAQRMLTRTRWRQLTERWLTLQLVERDRLLWVALGLIGLVGIGAFFIVLVTIPPSFELDQGLKMVWDGLPRILNTTRAAYGRIQPAFWWLLLVCVQTLAASGIAFHEIYRQKWLEGAIYRIFLITIMIGTTIFQWVVLFFRLKTFLLIPGWKWYFYEKVFPASHYLVFGVVLLGTLGLASQVVRSPQRWRLNLAMLMLWAATVQISFGFIEGGGFESLRIKYADGVFSRYAREAAKEPALWPALTAYEAHYGDDWYLGTKPPGVLLTYIAVEKVSNLVNPVSGDDARFLRLTRFAAYVFPFLAMLTLAALFALARRLIREPQDAALPGVLYLVCPNVILIPMFLDQVMYPLFFLLGLMLVLWAMEKHSLGLAFTSGAAIYLAMYFSLSLLPLLAMGGIWIALDAWLRRREGGLRAGIRMLLALAAGVIAAYLLLRLALNYDFFLRYTNAMTAHRRAKEFDPGLGQVLHSMFLNNSEFGTWTGFSMILLLLAQSVRTGLVLVRGQATRMDALLVSFWVTYLALNVGGQTNGEVQRLWLFLVPLVSLFAAEEAKSLFRRKERGLALVICLQLITTLLTFKYQDFYG